MGPTKLSAAALVLAGAALVQLPAFAPVPPPFCRVYLDPHDKFTRVVPNQPAQTANALTADAMLSTITVNYGSGFTGPAQIAFQTAVDIWKSQVGSTVPIVIDANFVDFGNTLLLGQAGATCAFTGFSGAIRPGTWFVAAISERLSRSDMTPGPTCASSSDIAASFNSTASWYFGTDGVPTSGKVDFISVVLHELGHGLGVIGTGRVAGGLGTVGDSGLPYIYDANVVDSAGTSILNSSVYPNSSTTLASLLQGSGVSGAGLFWGGSNAFAANGGARPVLYAPAGFQDGSSYSHLDEGTYPPGNLNSLMTPSIGFAEVIHTPGPAVLGMLTDMGWGNQTGGSCSFGLDNYTADVPPAGGSVSVELVTAAGCAWTASVSAPFVSGLTPTSGSSSARLQMSVAANTGTSARAGTVTIGTETFTIAQRGTSACTYSLTQTTAAFPAGGGTGTVGLNAAQGCTWIATSSDPSIATVRMPSGQGSANIIYDVSGATSTSSRTATLTIGGQGLAISQSGCSYALTQTTYAVSGAAGTLDVNVLTNSSCPWTTVPNASFITVLLGASATGGGTARLSIAANPSLAPRSGTVTIAGQIVTINQGMGFPTIAIDRSSLVYGAIPGASSLTAQTIAQSVRLTQSGLPGTVTWTASSNVPWMTVTPASGTGSAMLRVAVQFDPSLVGGAFRSGSVTIALNGAGNTVGPINVSLNLYGSSSPPPIGWIDSPAQGATGLAGSVPVTGWALDAIQVSRVTICRDAIAGETLAAEPRCGGLTKAFIGDATFIDGARPDVAASFPQFPLSTRAGWGYLMLTNFLPNTGTGTFGISVFATDAAGQTRLFGMQTITCDNAHSTAPFGAIDTPGQGDVVSGVVNNFGWVLSPGLRRSDPPGGGSVTVFVDGAPVGSPGGWNSRSDLTAAFPVSSYSGIGTALGVFGLDTTTLTNGVHTISWSVTDNLGTTSGVGSRFFTVSNASNVVAAAAAAPDVLGGAGSILLGRRGFDLNEPLDYFFPDVDGVVTIEARELDRIELQLEPGATGALITPQGEKPLPIGAQIDPATGLFTWAPGPGYIGRYDFVLGAHRVRIVLHLRARLLQ